MTDKDRGLVIDWLEEIVSEPEGWQRFYSSSEQRLLAEDALTLLKEQEPIAPEKEHSGSGITWWMICGACRTAINPNDKYCHECGRPVKWE